MLRDLLVDQVDLVFLDFLAAFWTFLVTCQCFPHFQETRYYLALAVAHSGSQFVLRSREGILPVRLWSLESKLQSRNYVVEGGEIIWIL